MKYGILIPVDQSVVEFVNHRQLPSYVDAGRLEDVSDVMPGRMFPTNVTDLPRSLGKIDYTKIPLVPVNT